MSLIANPNNWVLIPSQTFSTGKVAIFCKPLCIKLLYLEFGRSNIVVEPGKFLKSQFFFLFSSPFWEDLTREKS